MMVMKATKMRALMMDPESFVPAESSSCGRQKGIREESEQGDVLLHHNRQWR